jgi:hypothetical protein
MECKMDSVKSSCPFHAYRHILGVEKEGIHSIRVFDIAVVDLLLTILGAWALSKVFRVSFWLMFIVLMIVGLILHRLFCVKTTMTKWVFGDF